MLYSNNSFAVNFDEPVHAWQKVILISYISVIGMTFQLIQKNGEGLESSQFSPGGHFCDLGDIPKPLINDSFRP